MIFRIDDVCSNTDTEKLEHMVMSLKKNPNIEIWLGVSMFCSSLSGGERVFPSKWKVCSDYTVFYENDRVINLDWLVEFKEYYNIKVISHGIAHVDHRLLNYGAKEQSVLVSCKFLNTDVFIPPFHKWDAELESICFSHSINLIRYEWADWKHASYNSYDPNHEWWYTHSHDWRNKDDFKKWINKSKHGTSNSGSNSTRNGK